MQHKSFGLIDGATLHHLQSVENMTHQQNVQLSNVWYEKVSHTPPCSLEWN
jgi:hypothetical protein